MAYLLLIQVLVFSILIVSAIVSKTELDAITHLYIDLFVGSQKEID